MEIHGDLMDNFRGADASGPGPSEESLRALDQERRYGSGAMGIGEEGNSDLEMILGDFW